MSTCRRVGRHARSAAMVVDVVDPVADYAALMETLFDFAGDPGDVRRRLPDAL